MKTIVLDWRSSIRFSDGSLRRWPAAGSCVCCGTVGLRLQTTAAAQGPADRPHRQRSTAAKRPIPSGLPPLTLPAYQLPRPNDVVRATYKFAAEHPEVLTYMPCFCGCEQSGHGRTKTASSSPAPRTATSSAGTSMGWHAPCVWPSAEQARKCVTTAHPSRNPGRGRAEIFLADDDQDQDPAPPAR